MRLKNLLPVTIILLVFISLSAIPALAQNLRHEGYVKDEEGNPIVGAKVSYSRLQPGSGRDSAELETDSNGRFILALPGTTGGPWRITIQAAGYVTYETDVQLSSMSRNPNLNVKMKKTETVQPAEDSVRGKAESAAAEADKLVAEGKYDEAISVYENFMAENAETETIYKFNLVIGEIYEKKGDYETAIAKYNLVLDKDPNDANALLKIGNAYIRARKYDEAKGYYERLVQVKANDPTILFTLAEIMLDNGNYDGAIEFYQKAIDLNANFADAYMKLGYAYYGNKDWANAIKAFEKFIDIAPNRPEVEFIRSDIEACKKNMSDK